MAVAALLATLGSTAMADTSSVHRAAGKNGAKLQWLPYRPAARTIDRTERYAAEQHARQVEFTSYQSSDSADDQVDNQADSIQTDSVQAESDALTVPPPTPNVQPATPSVQPSKPVDSNNWQLPGIDNPAATPSEPSSESSSDSSLRPSSPVNQEMPGPPRDLPQNIREAIEKDTTEPRYKDYQVPTVPEERAEGLFKSYDDCPSEHDFKPIDELTDKVVISDGDYPKECKLPWKQFVPREWDHTLFTWKASGLCHNPLYFEDVQLERYGHSWGPYLQPVISQAHFFVTVPILPYKMGLNPPRECEYSLGYYRPGNCAPYMIDPLPLSVRAGLIQAGVVTGAAYLIP